MTDREFLDHWREAQRACLYVSHDERPQALFAEVAAEQAATERFGIDHYLHANHARFGERPRT